MKVMLDQLIAANVDRAINSQFQHRTNIINESSSSATATIDISASASPTVQYSMADVVKNGVPRQQVLTRREPVAIAERRNTPALPRKTNHSTKHVLGASEGNARIRSVKSMKTIDIFVSRLHPDTEESDVTTCVSENIQENYAKSISCEKLNTKYNNYSSFHVSVNVDSYDMPKVLESLMSAEAWPKGVLIRRYFKPKNGLQE